MIDTTRVVGYLIEGAWYCVKHAALMPEDTSDDGYASAVFAGDEPDFYCACCFTEQAHQNG